MSDHDIQSNPVEWEASSDLSWHDTYCLAMIQGGAGFGTVAVATMEHLGLKLSFSHAAQLFWSASSDVCKGLPITGEILAEILPSWDGPVCGWQRLFLGCPLGTGCNETEVQTRCGLLRDGLRTTSSGGAAGTLAPRVATVQGMWKR